MHKLAATLLLASLLASCRASLRPDFVNVVALLGKATGVDAGNCKSPDKVKAAYDADIAPAPLADALLPFARKVAEFCPDSRPFIRTESDVDLKTVAPMIGASSFSGDGRVQLEPWLFLRVAESKVIGLELELSKL